MTNQIILFAGLGLLALIFLMGILARMYRKAGPNEALIVYGFRGPRVIKGHGTVIFPMVENCRVCYSAASGSDQVLCVAGDVAIAIVQSS